MYYNWEKATVCPLNWRGIHGSHVWVPRKYTVLEFVPLSHEAWMLKKKDVFHNITQLRGPSKYNSEMWRVGYEYEFPTQLLEHLMVILLRAHMTRVECWVMLCC